MSTIVRHLHPSHCFAAAVTQCHAPGSKILMASGELKDVEDMEVGDAVMGPDSLPRQILEVHQGTTDMVRITPKKGEPFVVTLDHVLALKRTNDGRKLAGTYSTCSVRDWLAHTPSWRHVHKLYRVGVDFPTSERLPIPPYLLGVVLGDGSIQDDGIAITNANKGRLKRKVASLLHRSPLQIAERIHTNRCHTFGITKRTAAPYPRRRGDRRMKRTPHILLSALKDLGLGQARSGDKFIPHIYKVASAEHRLWLLAGLLDTDGCLSKGNPRYLAKCYAYVSKSKDLAEDVCFVARSLGFASYLKPFIGRCVYKDRLYTHQYYRVSIFGDTFRIPCQIKSKQVRIRKRAWGHDHAHLATQKLEYTYSPMVTGFEVEPIGIGPYYGFACDGDGLYLMGDFTVTHNSNKTTALVIPTVLDNEKDSLIIHDPKDVGDPIPGGEVYTHTAGWRAQVSKVIRFQPLSASSHRYDPLRAIRLRMPQMIRDLQIVSDMLTDPDGNGMDGLSDAGRHFTPMASDIHMGVFTHGLYTRTATTLGDFYRLWSGGTHIDELAKTMSATRHLDGQCHPVVVQAVRTIQETADREKSSLVNTARRALRLWSDPLVCRATSASDFTLRDLREGVRPFTLYLSFPFADAERMRPLSRLLLRQCLEYAAARGDGWAFDLKVILDEFQSLGRLPLLRHLLNYSLGRGVTLLLITPSLNEVDEVWGRNHPFLEGCGTKMVFGMRDGKVAERFLESMPTHEVLKRRTSWTPQGMWWKKTITDEVREEPLVSRSALLQLDETKVLAWLGSRVVILDKAYYWKHPVWLQRSRLPVPEAA